LGLELIGRHNSWAMDRGKFPLLVKILDAHDKLSVQVHPDDTYALAHEGNELGKTEMWVILHAQPGAEIILGLKQGTTPTILRQAIEESTVESCLHRLAVKAGDFVCVPSGTIHAILGGILIAEIQQNSNTTYRVYDWNRTQTGKARPLHIDSALDVISFDRVEPGLTPPLPIEDSEQVNRSMLCNNQYFTTERVIFAPGGEFTGEQNGDSLEIWGVIDGSITVNEYRLEAVQFTLLPASMGAYCIASTDGATCLRTYVSGSF
jgi:mannose-6-phosphate isomerase